MVPHPVTGCAVTDNRCTEARAAVKQHFRRCDWHNLRCLCCRVVSPLPSRFSVLPLGLSLSLSRTTCQKLMTSIPGWSDSRFLVCTGLVHLSLVFICLFCADSAAFSRHSYTSSFQMRSSRAYLVSVRDHLSIAIEQFHLLSTFTARLFPQVG